MIRTTVVLSFVALSAMQAFAINKCVDPNGKTAFQDAPCAGKGETIKVTPASGHHNAPPPLTQDAPTQASPAKSGTQKLHESLKDERIRQEKWFVMVDARQNLENVRLKCESEQKELAASKVWSKNNLAGATRDSSISQEMSAAAAACDSRIRGKEREVEAAEKVCAEIKCIAPS